MSKFDMWVSSLHNKRHNTIWSKRDAVRMHREKNLEYRHYLHEMHKELAQASAQIDQGKISPLNIKEMTEHVFSEQENE